jgi:hypothetical protein
MKVSTHNIRGLMQATLVSVAIAAIVAPPSQAKFIGAQVYRLSGQQGQSVPLVTDNAGRADARTYVRVYRLVHQQPESVPLVTDHSGAQPEVGSQDHSSFDPLINSTSGAGFHWRDAGIGAATVFAVVALGMGALVVLRRRRRSALA